MQKCDDAEIGFDTFQPSTLDWLSIATAGWLRLDLGAGLHVESFAINFGKLGSIYGETYQNFKDFADCLYAQYPNAYTV